MSPKQAKLAIVAALAVLGFTAFASSDARAGNNVKDFSCTTDPFGVHVDISGLGNTNVCIVGSADVDLNCACAGGGGNCPSDAKKQQTPITVSASESVEPKNGRVITTFSLPFNPTDGLCTSESPALACPGGQRARLVEWNIPSGGANFEMCLTDVVSGECSCAPEDVFATKTCGPTGDILFEGKNGSCLARFD